MGTIIYRRKSFWMFFFFCLWILKDLLPALLVLDQPISQMGLWLDIFWGVVLAEGGRCKQIYKFCEVYSAITGEAFGQKFWSNWPNNFEKSIIFYCNPYLFGRILLKKDDNEKNSSAVESDTLPIINYKKQGFFEEIA